MCIRDRQVAASSKDMPSGGLSIYRTGGTDMAESYFSGLFTAVSVAITLPEGYSLGQTNGGAAQILFGGFATAKPTISQLTGKKNPVEVLDWLAGCSSWAGLTFGEQLSVPGVGVSISIGNMETMAEMNNRMDLLDKHGPKTP